jgi:Ala-tRNA(Pro) deacylase
MNLPTYLDQMGIRYHLSHHPVAYTAQDMAAKEHVSGHQVIKPVVVEADGAFVMCALPASCRIDLDELRDQLQARQVRLADETAVGRLFAECELGAEPPIGRLFGLPTLMDESLISSNQVMFQAGTHQDAVWMTLADYRRAAQPEIAHFGRRP